MIKKTRSAFIVAATGSSSGKTVLTLGLMGALKKRGLVVQPFKSGPDYIDPGHHRVLLKRPSYNLDTWMMGKEGVVKTFTEKMHGSDVGVVEGVMGLFDGKDGRSDEGSTAHISKLLKLPVLLIVNAEKMARSAGAVILGFESYDPEVKINWVVFNRVGSPRHLKTLKDSLPKGSGVKVLGGLPKDSILTMPERHLGLTAPEDLSARSWRRFTGKAAALVEEHLDVDALLGSLPAIKLKSGKPRKTAEGPKVKIAVALDRAFSFYYEENLEVLKSNGAEVVFFSPMKDKKLPRGVCGVYLGGGYPELYASELSANSSLRKEILGAAENGIPIFAECGGLMYLGRTIEAEGRKIEAVGVFPWTVRMCKKRRALGYREVYLTEDCPFSSSGSVRGHEFHYSEIVNAPSKIKRAFRFISPSGEELREGYTYKNTVATYMHLHFASNPGFAEGFVKRCIEFDRLKVNQP